MKELEENLKEFEHKTREIKVKKLQRNRKDYIQGRVYVWMYDTQKKVTWANPLEEYSEQETSVFDSSESSGDEGPSRKILHTRMLQQRSEREDSGRGKNYFFRRQGCNRGRQKQ